MTEDDNGRPEDARRPNQINHPQHTATLGETPLQIATLRLFDAYTAARQELRREEYDAFLGTAAARTANEIARAWWSR